MNLRNFKITTVALSLVLTLTHHHDVAAVKMSTEEFKEYAREDAYWVVSVDCENGSEARIIQRKTDGDQWCSKELDGYCYDTKVEAADKVCGNQFSLAFSQVLESQRLEAQAQRQRAEAERKKIEQEKQRKAEQEKDRQNRLAIEAELLEIEQQKLSLRKEELALQKRAVEIEKQLETLAE